MSNESESKGILTIPKWDGKVESCAMYLVQISAFAKYHDCDDAMDLTAMTGCPTKSELIYSHQPLLTWMRSARGNGILQTSAFLLSLHWVGLPVMVLLLSKRL